jgi:hypothetical protein
MPAGPALAEGGYVNVTRSFEISGDRNRVSVVAKVTQAAAGGGLGIGVGFGRVGTTDSVAVTFSQATGRAGSRGLKVEGYSGTFKAVDGTNCSYEFRLSCNRAAYDWVEGRAYKVSFVRGNETAQGWLWTISIRDQQTGDSTKLVSFRTSFDKLATSNLNSVWLYANVDDCANVTPVAAVANKPAGAGSSVSWAAADKHLGCEGPSAVAPIDDGKVKFKIS